MSNIYLVKRLIINISLISMLLFSMAGCSTVKKAADALNKGKEKCDINHDNATMFSYNGSDYTILNESINSESLGKFVAYIQQIVLMDKNYKVIRTWSLDDAKEKEDTVSSSQYLITFQNIYSIDENSVAISVDGNYYKAVKSDTLSNDSSIIQYEKADVNEQATEGYHVNTKECTQIVCGGNIYQITDKKLGESELGQYLGVLGKHITFDADTHQMISSKELKKIEIDGKEESKSNRESWIYGKVYSIKEKNTQEAIAVSINYDYYIAEKS